MTRVICRSVLLAVISAGTISTGQAQKAPSDGGWSYSLTPYFWLPSVDGTLKYQLPAGGSSPSVDVNGRTLLNALDFGLMVSGEARRGQWSLFGDYIYLK